MKENNGANAHKAVRTKIVVIAVLELIWAARSLNARARKHQIPARTLLQAMSPILKLIQVRSSLTQGGKR